MDILNNAKSVIQSDIDLNSFEFIVQDPGLFPATDFKVTLEQVDDNGTVTAREIVEIESVTGNVFTIRNRHAEACVQSDIGNKQRTQESKNFTSWASISQYLTEWQYKAIETEINKKLNTTDFKTKWWEEMTSYVGTNSNFNSANKLLKLDSNGKVPAENIDIIVPEPVVNNTEIEMTAWMSISKWNAVWIIQNYIANTLWETSLKTDQNSTVTLLSFTTLNNSSLTQTMVWISFILYVTNSSDARYWKIRLVKTSDNSVIWESSELKDKDYDYYEDTYLEINKTLSNNTSYRLEIIKTDNFWDSTWKIARINIWRKVTSTRVFKLPYNSFEPYNYVWIAKESATSWKKVKIVTSWVVAWLLTWLTPGSFYYLQSWGTITTTKSNYRLFQALTSNTFVFSKKFSIQKTSTLDTYSIYDRYWINNALWPSTEGNISVNNAVDLRVSYTDFMLKYDANSTSKTSWTVTLTTNFE